jgi:hypothetical protein
VYQQPRGVIRRRQNWVACRWAQKKYKKKFGNYLNRPRKLLKSNWLPYSHLRQTVTSDQLLKSSSAEDFVMIQPRILGITGQGWEMRRGKTLLTNSIKIESYEDQPVIELLIREVERKWCVRNIVCRHDVSLLSAKAVYPASLRNQRLVAIRCCSPHVCQPQQYDVFSCLLHIK